MFRFTTVWLFLLTPRSCGAFQSYLDGLNSKKSSSPSIENLKTSVPPAAPPAPAPTTNNNNNNGRSIRMNSEEDGRQQPSESFNNDNNGSVNSQYLEYMRLRREQSGAGATSWTSPPGNNFNGAAPVTTPATSSNPYNAPSWTSATTTTTSTTTSTPLTNNNINNSNGAVAPTAKTTTPLSSSPWSSATSTSNNNNNDNKDPGPPSFAFSQYDPNKSSSTRTTTTTTRLPGMSSSSGTPYLQQNPPSDSPYFQPKETAFASKSIYSTPRLPLESELKPNEEEEGEEAETLSIVKVKQEAPADEILGETKNLLKKHVRLALTGGVPLNREMTGERFAPALDTAGMTERILKSIRTASTAAGGAGGTSTWEAFLEAEEKWARLREYVPDPYGDAPPPFVTEQGGQGNPKCYAKLHHQKARELDFDVAVCGGTMGIFFAVALQLKGHRVCVVEAGQLQGKDQEWNVGMDELEKLRDLGILTQEDIDASVQTEFSGVRSGLKNKEVPVQKGYLDNGVGYETFTEGVMNLGVSPKILIDRVAKRFQSLGGVVKEQSEVEGICVMKDIGAALDFGEAAEPITAHIVIDSMGANSPVTRQQRYGVKPDGVAVVVGSCASGYDPQTNVNGDIVYTNSAIQDKGENGGRMQYFFQSFPVGIGRNGKAASDTKTTYMFTYMDAHQQRPTLEALMEDYWRLLPLYQPSIENPEEDLEFQRVLFAYYPSYRDSPLQPGFHRVLAVGDASGVQSPLSFGGFGAMTRHVGRISNAVTEALEMNLLTKHDLAQINPYTPNLSASHMFQKARSVRMGQPFVDNRFINRLLATNYQAMDDMGPRVMKPFLRDVVRFDGVVGGVARGILNDPTFLPQVVTWVGIPTLMDWMGHVSMMGMYGALDNYVAPWLGPIGNSTLRRDRSRFQFNRQLDAWKYGSGNDCDVSKIARN